MTSTPRALGRYVLKRRLAAGGMGEVYLGEVQGAANFTKRVAIKRILPHLAQTPGFEAKFIDEAHVMVQLHHGNIVPVLGLGDEAGELFIVMEYLPGRDLRAVLQRLSSAGRPCSVELAIWLLCEVCDALDYAHRKTGADGQPLQIVHRDVSPSNVMLGASGEVKLLDFGIARARGSLHQSISGTLQGKFAYMSPEQAEGLAVDARSDIFSAGLVLYELLTGVRPLEAESETETLRRVRSAEILPPSTHRPEISPDLDAALMSALTLRPSDRWTTAADFGRALSQAQLLRRRLGYKGEIRARGQVLRDQLRLMIRCGIDAMVIAEADAEGVYAASASEFSEFYQSAADTSASIFVKRQKLRQSRAAE